MSKQEEVTATTVFVAILAIGCVSLSSVWALVTLWGWFAVPLGVPVVTWQHALGVRLLLVTLIWPAIGSTDTQSLAMLNRNAFTRAFAYVLIVGCGYLLRS